MAQSKTSIWIDGSQAGTTLKTLKKEVSLLNREINNLPVGSEKYNQKVQELAGKNQQLAAHRKQIRGISQSYGQARTGMGDMLKQFAPFAGGLALIGGAIRGIGAGISSWYNNNKQLEKSLDTLQSITGASTQDIKFYKEEAVRMGKETTQSATDVVEAMKMIGSQKPELLQNRDALASVTEQVIVLAEAAEISMEEAAKAVTGTLNQFNKGAEATNQVMNSFAAGSKAGAAGISEIGDSMDKSGAVMAGYNVSVEEGVGLIETLAEKNLKGAEAGTKLRNILLTMQTLDAIPPEALSQVESYGVDIAKVTDTSLPFQERLQEISKIAGDASAMTKVFGKENVVAAKAILGNTEAVQQYTEAVTGTNTAYEQAAINTDNLEGDIKSLGSAWEGLTLSLSGGESILRPIVQAGTDMLNWLSDSIVAIREWDVTSMQTQVMKLAKSLPLIPDELERMWEQQIKINEITNDVVKSMQDEARSSTILTKALRENNAMLEDGNVTAERKAEIEAQNATIIDQLNTKYPELTKNIDLHNASAEDLVELQKQINDNLLEQAINTARAAQQETILTKITEASIKLAQARQAYQKEDASSLEKYEALQNFSEAQKDLELAKEELMLLDDTMGDVSDTVKSMDVDWGADYTANTEIASAAAQELSRLQKQLAKETNEDVKKAIREQIKANKDLIKSAEKGRNDMIKNASKAEKEASDATAQAIQEANDKADQAAKEAKKRYEDMRNELDKLIESAEKFRNDLNYNKRLDAIKDEQEKELFILEESINEKYAKEIEAAEKLSKQKGAIGEQAQEELNALLVLKEEELQLERNKIVEKYAKQKAEDEYDRQKEANLQYLQQQETLEQSIVELKVAKAQMAVDDLREIGGEQYANALSDLEQALTEQAELEKRKRIEALMDLEAEGIISKEEYNNRKKQVELEFLEEIEQMHADSNDRLAQMDEEKIQQTIEVIQGMVGVIADLSQAEMNRRFDEIDRIENRQKKKLEKDLKDRVISQEEYDAKVQQIEEQAEQRRKAIELEQAKRKRAQALFDIAIQTAVAIMEAAPNIPLQILAGATGVAQAAVVLSQPLPQMFEGGFTTAIGADDGKTYNARNIGRPNAGLVPGGPSVALINEEGPEYFVPHRLLRNAEVMDHIRAIEGIRLNQFVNGGFTAGAVSDTGNSSQLLQMIMMNTATMKQLIAILSGLSVKVGDSQLDDMAERKAELDQIRA